MTYPHPFDIPLGNIIISANTTVPAKLLNGRDDVEEWMKIKVDHKGLK